MIRIIKLIILMTICATNLSLSGQINRLYYIDDFTTLDSARFEITYKVEKVPDTTKPNDKLIDVQRLLIGKEISKTCSYLLFQNDSICTILENQDVNFPAPPSGAGTDEIYRNLLTGDIKVKNALMRQCFAMKKTNQN